MKQKPILAFILLLAFLLLGAPVKVSALQSPLDVRVVDTRVGGTLTITWANHNESDLDYSQVFRSTQKDTIGELKFDRVKTNFAVDAGLNDGQKYYYTVMLVDKAGQASQPSNQASGVPTITTTPPPAPINLKATDLLTGNSIRLNWAMPSIPNLGFFRIYRKMALDSDFALIADKFKDSTYIDTSVENGVAYEYSVRTVSTAGIESSGGLAKIAPTIDNTPPDSPKNFDLDDTQRGGELRLSWVNPSSPDFTIIRIYRSTNGERGVVVAEINDRRTQYLDSNLEIGRTYYYTLIAIDRAGLESQPSAQLKALPTYPGAVSKPVTALTARDRGTGGTVELKWSNPSDRNFSHVNIYRGHAGEDLGILIADNIKGTSYADEDLSNGIFFQYTVKPVSKTNIEGPSQTVKAMATASSVDKKKPSPPVNVTVQDAGDASTLRIRFQITDDKNLSHFRIYRSLELGKAGELIRDNYHYTAFDDTSLAPDQTYYYIVRTVGRNGVESDNIRQSVGIATKVLPDELIPGNDSDGDGLPDAWERAYGLHVRIPDDTNIDSDEDGLSLLEEYRWGTNPWDPDTDGDGFTDGAEVKAGYSPIQGKGIRLEIKDKPKMPQSKASKSGSKKISQKKSPSPLKNFKKLR